MVPSSSVGVPTLGRYNYYAEDSVTPVGEWMVRNARRRQLDLIRPFLCGSDSALLEIGPGFGQLTELFLEVGYHNYTVVEPNDLLRKRLEERGVRTKDYTIPLLQEYDNSYDAIIMFHVLEHLGGVAEAGAFVSEAARVLLPGGLLCILSPDYLHLRQDFFNVDYTHAYVTTVRRVAQLFHDGGFDVLKCTYFSGMFAGVPATLVSNLVRLGLCFSSGNRLRSRLYKLKTSLLRSFLIIGKKRAQPRAGGV